MQIGRCLCNTVQLHIAALAGSKFVGGATVLSMSAATAGTHKNVYEECTVPLALSLGVRLIDSLLTSAWTLPVRYFQAFS